MRAASALALLAFAASAAAAPLDLTFHDAKRDRDVPVRVYLPAESKPQPVVLFSHGLGGSREGNAFMGEHWAAHGYVAVFLQHPGSDTTVWKDVPRAQAMGAMQGAASVQNYQLRVADVRFVLDELERRNAESGSPLAHRMDLAHVGMSGHSFGAVTTQAVSGQKQLLGRSPTDARIKAAIAFSPSSPQRGDAQQAFGSVAIPWMLMTGTADRSPIRDVSADSRAAVFAALPPGHKYELVLDRAEHSAFTDRALPGDKEARNPNHHRAILALSTAFWDAYLRDDPKARAWLDGADARSVLEPKDRWETK